MKPENILHRHWFVLIAITGLGFHPHIQAGSVAPSVPVGSMSTDTMFAGSASARR